MNKPISTWTQTFYKLGYTLRRIWHDEQDCSNNYTPLAIEVLEDRQMLSGAVLDNPSGGGVAGATDVAQVASAMPGEGYSEQAALSLASHWRTGFHTNYAWNSAPTLYSYFGSKPSGVISGTAYHAEAEEFDKDLGTYFVSFYKYDYTITVSRSTDMGGMGGGDGPDESGATNWYKEHLHITVSGSTIETTNQLLVNDYIDNGVINSVNPATLKQIGTHSGYADYTFTGTLDPNSANSYSRVDISLGELFQLNYNYQTSVDSFWERGNLPGNVSLAGTVQVNGGSLSQRGTSFGSSKTTTGRDFNINGSGSYISDNTITYQNASLTLTTAGFTAVDLTGAAGERLHPKNPDGTYAALPIEGSRRELKLNGTQTTTANANSSFGGNGNMQLQGSNTVRIGVVNYSASALTTATNDYVRTYTSDQTILGATEVFSFSPSVGFSSSLEKLPGGEIDIAVQHSYSQTTNKNRSEAELNYGLQHDYTANGKVKQTTQFVNSPTGLSFSYYRLRDDYNIETQYRDIEQRHFTKPQQNSLVFSRTDGSTKLTGPSTRLTAFATVTTSAQPGFTHETVSTGNVFVTGGTNLTQIDTETTINSSKSLKNETLTSSSALEITLDNGGNANTPPAMTGTRDSGSRSVVTASSTVRMQDTINRRWNFADTGVVTLHDDSVYRRYTTEYSGNNNSKLHTTLEAIDGQGNKHSDGFNLDTNNTTTADGLSSITGRQEFWTTGDGAAIAAAAVGEASIVIQSLIITFTPRPTPPPANSSEVQAVAGGSASQRKYDRKKSGTSTHIRLGSYSDDGHNEGYDRLNGTRITLPGTATGGTATGGATPTGSSGQTAPTVSVATTTTHGANDTWDKTVVGDSSYSLTDLYTYNEDGSYTVKTTGWSESNGENDGEVGNSLGMTSKSGNLSQGAAMQAITTNGNVSATAAQWSTLANQMNNDSFGGFAEDFSMSSLKGGRRSMENASNGLRTEFDVTHTYTPTTIQVPAGSAGGTGGDATQTVAGQTGSTETITVPSYTVTTSGNTKVVSKSSYRIDHIEGETEFWYAKQSSAGNNGNSHGAPSSGSLNPSPGESTGYRWLSNGRSVTTLSGQGNFESYSTHTTVTTTYGPNRLITIHTIEDVDGDTGSVATSQTTTSDRLWQDDYTNGYGRIAGARSSSLPPNGPNLIGSSTYRYDTDLTLKIDPSLFPASTTSSGSSNGTSGSSGTSSSNGGQSNYTPGSGTSTNPGGSGSSNQSGTNPGGSSPTGPTLAEQYQNMKTGISKWDASDKGFDLTGTVKESSGSNFLHKENLSQSSEDLMRMEQGRKVGVVKFEASSKEEMSRETSSAVEATHGVGRQFTINKAEDKVKTNHNWMDKQISSRSEYREYAAPTSAPSTTMTALRTTSASTSQSLLGVAPSGSQLLTELVHTTFYFSPLADVTKTVKNWIEPYVTDGSPNAEPILYRYLDEVKVNVGAWVTKTGYDFNGSTTLRSKATFVESDQGTIWTYRGLDRQEPNSYNNWKVTFVSLETHTGGVNQTINHSKPSGDNTISIPNQGTVSTVAPGGELSSGISTLSTFLTVLKPIVDFVGELPMFTGYTSLVVSTSGGNSDGVLEVDEEAERIAAIIDEFKRRYPTEAEYLNRFLKKGEIKFKHMWLYNVHYKGGYDFTTSMTDPDVIYFDPNTSIERSAELLLEYLHVMQHYGNSKFSSEMNPKVDVETFLNNLEAAGVPLALATGRPYRVGMADLKLYNDMGVMVADVMPAIGITVSIAETVTGKTFEFATQFEQDLSPTQRFVVLGTAIGGTFVVAVAYKVGGKIFLRIIGQADTLENALKFAPKTPFPWRSIDNAIPDSRLVDRAIALRQREGLMNAAGMRRNAAVAKVHINGKEEFIERLNTGNGGPHSEELIATHVKELRDAGNQVEVLELFTERIPCTNSGGCRTMITEHMPGVKIFAFTRRYGPAAIRDLLDIYGL